MKPITILFLLLFCGPAYAQSTVTLTVPLESQPNTRPYFLDDFASFRNADANGDGIMDMNEDGFDDLIVGNQATRTVQVWGVDTSGTATP